MTRFDPQTTLLAVALENELPRYMVAGWTIIYTGVGKVNAAIALCDAIAMHQPKNVVNYGSAGALCSDLAGLHRVTRFLQRDMDVRTLGFALGQTPFDDYGEILAGTGGLSCGTGDQFVSSPPELKSDLVDMEAYALARICQQKAINFYCFKFISDNADGDAAHDWSQHLTNGAELFSTEILQQ